MRKRWKLAVGLGGIAAALVIVPVIYIEGFCRSPLPGFDTRYVSRLPENERRPEARTWLTYPEWHIVYSADSFGRHLASGQPPSGYRYWNDVEGFWRGYCAVNRAAAGSAAAGDAKVMLYTIGISFTAEMGVKALYENTLGRLFEWIGGWASMDDRYAAQVQQRYGAFMHQTPWYAFPFGTALSGLWTTRGEGAFLRHWERRFALSAEYGVKAGYAKAIGAASGATLGRDELTLRFVAGGTPGMIDPRLRPVRASKGLTVIEAPRYAEFTALLRKMAARNVQLVEIAGNDDILVTMLVKSGATPPGRVLLDMPLADRPGWRRVGVAVKVPQLLPLFRAQGAAVEHVYDY